MQGFSSYKTCSVCVFGSGGHSQFTVKISNERKRIDFSLMQVIPSQRPKLKVHFG